MRILKLQQIIYFLILLLICITVQAHAQEFTALEDHVYWTPDGMIVIVNDAALSPEVPVDGLIEAVVYRRLEGQSSYSEVGRLQRAESWEEFVDRGSDRLVAALMSAVRVDTEEELWENIQENPRAGDYGFLYYERDFQKAFGLIFIDEETADLPEGEEVSYRMTYIMENGEESEERYTDSEIVGTMPNILAPRSINFVESENLVGGQWASPIEGSEDAFFANIYRQKGVGSEFELLPNRLMANRNEEEGIITYSWEESAEPEEWYRFFVEPIDFIGNTGPRSDTLQVISVNFDNIPLMNEVEISEDPSGIRMNWQQIDYKPYLTGIEVRRSRDSRSGFVTLDTLDVTATEFVDSRVVPNQTYYYEFRVVTMRSALDFPSAVASGSFENKEMPPSIPFGLKAIHEGENIRLQWNSVEEPDLYAYYVYRSTSRYDSLVVASRAITDSTTFIDTNETLDGRTNYTYAVKSVNMSGLESELSDFVVIRPSRYVQPLAPVGISGYAEYNRVRISWRDVQRRDDAVIGYHVYRSLQKVEVASASSLPEGVERLTETFITTTSFDDLDVTPGQQYYYAVSSVDLFDVESELSSFFDFTTSNPDLSAPSQVSVRAINGQIEMRWNRTHQAGVSGYIVYRRTREQSEPEALTTLDLEETTFTDNNTSLNTLYWYSVSVIGGNSESERSREQSVRIQ